jgi:DNA-binding transcriptional LysR family regulator
VEISAGVALLPEPTLRREVHSGALVAVPLTEGRLVRSLGIIHHRHHKLSSTALRFLDLLRQPEANGSNEPTPLSSAASANGSARAPKRKSMASV